MSYIVAILSFEDDLHALAVQHELRQRGHECFVVETDALDRKCSLSWSPAGGAQIRGRDGDVLDPADLDLVWWRRINRFNPLPPDLASYEFRFIENEWKWSLVGSLLASFRGIWINDPERTRVAENKLFQLSVAREIGLRIPRTLVSQDPARVHEFVAELGGRAVAKAIRGAVGKATVAAEVTLDSLKDEDGIRACPAIYQELIEGTEHLRVHCFGEHVTSVRISSHEMDWRRHLGVPFRPHVLETSLERQLLGVLERLGLRMGVVDLKLSAAGEAVWLEINPQGQFLFAEGLGGVPLTTSLVDFFVEELAKTR